MPDSEDENQIVETDQEFLPIYWKKDKAGAWRVDVDVALADSDIAIEKCVDSESSVIEEESDIITDYDTDSSGSSESDSD